MPLASSARQVRHREHRRHAASEMRLTTSAAELEPAPRRRAWAERSF
jgi:hypothetical protein